MKIKSFFRVDAEASPQSPVRRLVFSVFCAAWAVLATSAESNADVFQMPTQSDVPELVAALRDANLRQGAVVALSKVGAPAVEELILALKDDGLARWAAHALGRIGPDSLPAVPALTQAAGDEDEVLRIVAVEALGEIGPGADAAVPVLLKSLSDPKPPVRVEAAIALGRIRPQDDAVAEALVAALTDEAVREASGQALVRLGKVAVPALTRALADDPVRLDAAAVLRVVGPAAAVAAGVDRLTSDDVAALLLSLRNPQKAAAARQSAAESLGELASTLDSESSRTVAIALVDALTDDAVRMSAAKALSRFEHRAVPLLVDACSKDDAKARHAAARALMHLGEQAVEARPALVAMLQDRDREVRRAAAQALESIGADATGAVPALIKVVDSNDAEPVRAAAVKALVRAEPAAKDAVVAAFFGQIRENNSYGIRMLCEWGIKKVDPVAAEKANIR